MKDSFALNGRACLLSIGKQLTHLLLRSRYIFVHELYRVYYFTKLKKDNGYKLNVDYFNKRLENQLMDNEIQNPNNCQYFFNIVVDSF